MGVPGLFKYVAKRFPKTVEQRLRDSKKLLFGEQSCDNLYIDLNHVVHSCSHSMGLTPDDGPLYGIFGHIKGYLASLMKVAKPAKLLFVALDGVAPRAKLCQQRTRRFLAAYRTELSEKHGSKLKGKMEHSAEQEFEIPKAFNPNIISPGTEFMEELFDLLFKHLEEEVETKEEWSGLKVIFSSSSEPGEGEHKIMKFIRHQRSCSGYKADTKHAVFGQDADLILLSLLTHEPNLVIIREDMKNKNYEDFFLLRIGTLRQYLKYGLNPFIQNEVEVLEEERDEIEKSTEEDVADEEINQVETYPEFGFERTLEDFVFLTFLLGNDFVPSIPSLDVYDWYGGLDRLVMCYKRVRNQNSDFLTKEGKVNASVFQKVLHFVAEDEPRAYRRLENARRKFNQKTSKEKPHSRSAKEGPLNSYEKQGFVSVGEIAADTNLDEVLGDEYHEVPEEDPDKDLKNMDEETLVEVYKKRLGDEIDKVLLKNNDVDSVQLTSNGYEGRYYAIHFKPPGGDTKKCAGMVSRSYFEGLCWAFAYYTLGPNPVITNEDSPLQNSKKKTKKERQEEFRYQYATWDWYYPYYYAPLIGDLAKFCKEATLKTVLQPGYILLEPQEGLKVTEGPVPPFIQLLSVLPPQSAEQCLPKGLARLLTATTKDSTDKLKFQSPVKKIKSMFLGDISNAIDATGKAWAHTVVVKLPFGDPEKLSTSAQEAECDAHLTEEELERNTFDSAYLFVSRKNSSEMKVESEKSAEMNEARDPLLNLIVPEFDNIDLNQTEWEDGKATTLSFEVSGIVSRPTPSVLLEGAIDREEVICGHCFHIKDRPPKKLEDETLLKTKEEIQHKAHQFPAESGRGKGKAQRR